MIYSFELYLLNGKSSIVCFLLFACLALPVYSQKQLVSQKLYSTQPNMSEHFEERMRGFEKQPIVTGRVVFLGNSITEMGNWQMLLNDTTILNRGIGGDVSFGVLSRLHEITGRKPSKIFLMIGINDIGNDVPVNVIAENCDKIIARIKQESPDTRIFLQSVLPVNASNPHFPKQYDKMKHIAQLNKLLSETAKSNKITFVNLFPLFLQKGSLNAEYTTDGLHLNDKGYKVWVEYIKKEKLLE